jgi:hypothetical protein
MSKHFLTKWGNAFSTKREFYGIHVCITILCIERFRFVIGAEVPSDGTTSN